MPDTIFWNNNKNGHYSVKHGYWWIQSHMQTQARHTNKTNFWKIFWKLELSERLKWFCWKIVHDILPTKVNLNKRNIPVEDRCVFCNCPETSDHLFLYCHVANKIWFTSNLSLNTHANPNLRVSDWVQNWILYLHSNLPTLPNQFIHLIIPLWAIWLHRNEVLFKGVNPNPPRILHIIQKELDRWEAGLKIQETYQISVAGQQIHQEVPVSWEWNPNSIEIANLLITDGAWKDTPNYNGPKAAFGWVLKENGRSTNCGQGKLYAGDALQAELTALLQGLRSARETCNNLECHTDCSKIIQLLHNRSSTPPLYVNLLMDITLILSTFNAVRITKVDRVAVHEAHLLAKMACIQ